MNIIINGEAKEIQDGMSIQNMLIELQIIDKVMACAVNMEIVKKDNWSEFSPKEGDKIEVLEFVGGG